MLQILSCFPLFTGAILALMFFLLLGRGVFRLLRARKWNWRPALCIFLLLCANLFYLFTPKQVDLGFATELTVTCETGPFRIRISGSDLEETKQLCQGQASLPHSVPGCGFGGVELLFTGNGKMVLLCPAGDGCETMEYGVFFYDLPKENRARLEAILKTYGVTMP